MTTPQKAPLHTRRSRDWKPFQPTLKRPGQWVQAGDGFVKIGERAA